jgi:hypothetical protein
VFGDGFSPEAADEIAMAFRIVFGTTTDEASQAPYVEGGSETIDLLTEAAKNAPTADVRTRVERIRFLDTRTADVRFQIGLGGGPHGPVLEGRAIVTEDRWLVARDTVLRVVAMAGVRPGFRRR